MFLESKSYLKPVIGSVLSALLISTACSTTIPDVESSVVSTSVTAVGGITGRERDPGQVQLPKSNRTAASPFDAFPAARARGWSDPAFFPIGVWNESVVDPIDTKLDQQAGINTYFDLTPNSDLKLVRDAGMSAVVPPDFRGGQVGPETVGWLLGDEPEQYGADNVIAALDEKLKQAQSTPAARERFTYTNFTGNAALPVYSPSEEVAQDWFKRSSFSSMDIYWYTSSGFCKGSVGGEIWKDGSGDPQSDGAGYNNLSESECRRPSNYGYLVDRVKQLSGPDAAFALIENGQPFASTEPAIEPDQLAAATWSSIIRGARGIIYFNHTFATECQGQHNLRVGATSTAGCYTDVRRTTADLNSKIRILSPALNGVELSSGDEDGVQYLIKYAENAIYVFAAPGPLKGGSRTGQFSIRLPDVAAGLVRSDWASALFEDRLVRLSEGVLTDTFASDTTVHIYKISR